jgi:hypothetical protein
MYLRILIKTIIIIIIIYHFVKNGAGGTSANKFIHNLEYEHDIKKRRETCKLKLRL